MFWGILGPVLVTDDAGTEIPIAAGRQRVLLAALLARANQTVSVDSLVEALWDGQAPPSAVRTLRVYVVRLRHTLGPQMGARIVTRLPGYLAQAGEDELDLLRFERLCRDSWSAASDRAWPRAADLLAQALDLWRGEPLADVASEVLRARVLPRLEQVHLQAVEGLVDAEMRAGRHEHVVPELRELTARYPLREHLHAQLMQALAGSGRRAEALEVYQNARRVLVDELGIEPGRELREVQKRVLSRSGPPAAGPVQPKCSRSAMPGAQTDPGRRRGNRSGTGNQFRAARRVP